MPYPLPPTLSPSRVTAFTDCALAFRFANLDRLPEPPSPHAIKGTLVHSALEALFAGHEAPERTPEAAARCLDAAALAMASDPEYASLGLDDEQAAAFVADAHRLLPAYFALEDPRQVHAVGIELRLEAQIGGVTMRGIIDRLDRLPDGSFVVNDYKGLALDTPLPTPAGWTTMADVEIGDEVLSAHGYPTRVIAKSAIHHRPCYRIEFSDGSHVICDNEHLWNVGHVGASSRGDRTPKTVDADTLYAMHQRCRAERRPQRLVIENASPFELPHKPLPIDPWLLGVWLGDGRTTDGSPTVGHEHDDVALTSQLRALGLLGNKHVPQEYLRASLEQRLSLLQGLMDTQGQWHRQRARAEFVTTTAALAHAVRELVHSLGASSRLFTEPQHDRIRPGSTVHHVEFRPTGFNPFRLPRKADPVAALLEGRAGRRRYGGRSTRRAIVDVVPITSVPTQCIAVDAPDSLYLCGPSMIPTHNTGRSPGERYEKAKMLGVDAYALLVERVLGVRPAAVRLLYLGDGVAITCTPSDQNSRFIETKVGAIWQTIQRANATDAFKPKPGHLCNWCSFQAWCPSFGGDPDEARRLGEELRIERRVARAAGDDGVATLPGLAEPLPFVTAAAATATG